MAEPLHVVVNDDSDTTHVDPDTGTITTQLPDGKVVVQLDAVRSKKDDGEDDKWFANLADEMDDAELSQIANDLIEAIGADDRSRQGYLSNIERGLDLLGLQLKEPKATVGDSSAGIEGMSSVTNPLLLEAVLKGWANAYGEFLPANGPAKIRNDSEETAQTSDLADALERDFNHYLTVIASEYYPETSHMLLWGTYFGGSGFKKVYRCPMRRRPTSESVDVKDLIVSDTTKDLRSCGRITHQIKMRPSVMKRMKLIGAYRDVVLTQPAPTVGTVDNKIASMQGVSPNKDRPEDQPYTIWECQCELDIPEYAPGKFKDEGIPIPYLVTIDKDSREVLALRRDWREEDEECERKRMYVRYPYVPGPGFYGTGLLNILGNSSAAMTAAWREALDAGMFANFPGGLVAKLGGRQNTSDFRLSPGTFAPIETNGMPIGQVVMGLPYKDVTPGLLALIDKITQQSQALGGVADIPTAEGIQNVPVGTMLAQIEQATKVMSAAHKGMHTAQSEEFLLLLDLFREDPEAFWRNNRVCKGFWDEQKFLQALEECELIPASDPNTPSHIHRVMEALALTQLIMLPDFKPFMDPKETLLRCMRAIKSDPMGIVRDPPPQQGPADLAGQAKMLDAQTKAQELPIKMAKVQQDAQSAAAELQAKKEIEGIKLESEHVIHQFDAQKFAHQQHSDQLSEARAAQQENQTHGLEVAKAQQAQGLEAAKVMQDTAQANQDAAQAQQEHGLEVAKHVHERVMDHKEHALAEWQAKHPPKPAAAKPKSKK